MENIQSTTIVFIANEWLHAHDVETHKMTFTSRDEEFVHNDDYESFQEYVDDMVNMELDGHAQHFVNAFAITEEAFNNMIDKALIARSSANS